MKATARLDANEMAGEGSQRRFQAKPAWKGTKGKGPVRMRQDCAYHPSHTLKLWNLSSTLQAAPDTEPSEDDMHSEDELQPPEPGQAITTTASTPPDLIRQVNYSETPKVVEENNKKTTLIVNVDATEKAKQDAIFSYNVVDLLNLPLKLTNPYNTRPINKSKVRALRNALLEEGFRVFSHENRIMVVISPSDLDPSCITMTSDPAAEPKPLLLKMDARLEELPIIGGQHRREAVLLIMSEVKKRMELLRRDIKSKGLELAKLVKKPPTTEEARRREAALKNDMKALETELSCHEKSKDVVGRWGVILLDPGRSRLILLVYQCSLSPSKNK